MTRKLLVASGAALVLLMLSAVSNPADARRGGGYGFSGARAHIGARSHFRARPHFHSRAHIGHRRFHRHHHHHRRGHRHIFIGPPVIYGSTYYYGDCHWLRRRALRTGSPYWWNRYYDCIDGY